MKIHKTLEPTGDLAVKFTEDELTQLGMQAGDKFSIHFDEEGIVLKKFATIDIDIDEWNKDVLVHLIRQSCERDVSVNEVITDILDEFIKVNDR